MINYAILSTDNLCIGRCMLSETVDVQNYVPITEWDEDFLWRKYENGVWSTEKFEPLPPVSQKSLQEQIDDLTLLVGDLMLGVGA